MGSYQIKFVSHNKPICKFHVQPKMGKPCEIYINAQGSTWTALHPHCYKYCIKFPFIAQFPLYLGSDTSNELCLKLICHNGFCFFFIYIFD